MAESVHVRIDSAGLSGFGKINHKFHSWQKQLNQIGVRFGFGVNECASYFNIHYGEREQLLCAETQFELGYQ